MRVIPANDAKAYEALNHFVAGALRLQGWGAGDTSNSWGALPVSREVAGRATMPVIMPYPKEENR